jgi:protein FRG1
MEMSFTKKFQSFQNLCFKEGQTVKVSKEERRRLKEAKKAGKLHEELLNRRSKMKADKFCK